MASLDNRDRCVLDRCDLFEESRVLDDVQDTLKKQVVSWVIGNIWNKHEHVNVGAWQSKSICSGSKHVHLGILYVLFDQILNELQKLVSKFDLFLIDLNPIRKLKDFRVIICMSESLGFSSSSRLAESSCSLHDSPGVISYPWWHCRLFGRLCRC